MRPRDLANLGVVILVCDCHVSQLCCQNEDAWVSKETTPVPISQPAPQGDEDSATTIDDFFPSSGNKDGGYLVTLMGRNLARIETVYFGNRRAEIDQKKERLCTVKVPKLEWGDESKVTISCVTDQGAKTDASKKKFEYISSKRPFEFDVGYVNVIAAESGGFAAFLVSLYPGASWGQGVQAPHSPLDVSRSLSICLGGSLPGTSVQSRIIRNKWVVLLGAGYKLRDYVRVNAGVTTYRRADKEATQWAMYWGVSFVDVAVPMIIDGFSKIGGEH